MMTKSQEATNQQNLNKHSKDTTTRVNTSSKREHHKKKQPYIRYIKRTNKTTQAKLTKPITITDMRIYTYTCSREMSTETYNEQNKQNQATHHLNNVATQNTNTHKPRNTATQTTDTTNGNEQHNMANTHTTDNNTRNTATTDNILQTERQTQAEQANAINNKQTQATAAQHTITNTNNKGDQTTNSNAIIKSSTSHWTLNINTSIYATQTETQTTDNSKQHEHTKLNTP